MDMAHGNRKHAAGALAQEQPMVSVTYMLHHFFCLAVT